jgi:hypothetical protein
MYVIGNDDMITSVISANPNNALANGNALKAY